MIAGLVPLSIALVLAAQLVLSTVIAVPWASWSITTLLAILIGVLWWLFPRYSRNARNGE